MFLRVCYALLCLASARSAVQNAMPRLDFLPATEYVYGYSSFAQLYESLNLSVRVEVSLAYIYTVCLIAAWIWREWSQILWGRSWLLKLCLECTWNVYQYPRSWWDTVTCLWHIFSYGAVLERKIAVLVSIELCLHRIAWQLAKQVGGAATLTRALWISSGAHVPWITEWGRTQQITPHWYANGQAFREIWFYQWWRKHTNCWGAEVHSH